MNERPKTNVRKKQVKNKSRRNRNGSNLLIYAFLTITLVSLMVVLSLTVFFKASEITVVGASERYSKEDIISAAGVNIGDNLFLTDTDLVENNIEEKLPYIEKAELSKKFPLTFKITVKETKPDRIYNLGNNMYALCKGEKVLEITDEYFHNYAYYDIPVKEVKAGKKIGIDKEISETYNELIEAIDKSKIENITVISFKKKVDIKLVYDNQLILKLGTTENINDKLITAIKVIERVKAKHGDDVEGSINLKYLVEDNIETYFTQESILDFDIIPEVYTDGEKSEFD
ncbi:MAG: FtsQ-type POTRA domain-containing protein [Clostridia bacterium]|nr:FtsQ-type POTRA domain-containing protein [Clostridia bacterium]